MDDSDKLTLEMGIYLGQLRERWRQYENAYKLYPSNYITIDSVVAGAIQELCQRVDRLREVTK